MDNKELYHHGILGQKWGVRRFQNYDGSLTEAGRKRYSPSDARIIKKGTEIHRISVNRKDPTSANRKYVSLTEEDNERWKYIYSGAAAAGATKVDRLYDVMYVPTRDLAIAPATKLGELYVETYVANRNAAERIVSDTVNAVKTVGVSKYRSNDEALSLNLSVASQTGKAFIDQLIARGYDGIEDANGRNYAKDPLIIFNPDKNLKRKSSTEVWTRSKKDLGR